MTEPRIWNAEGKRRALFACGVAIARLIIPDIVFTSVWGILLFLPWGIITLIRPFGSIQSFRSGRTFHYSAFGNSPGSWTIIWSRSHIAVRISLLLNVVMIFFLFYGYLKNSRNAIIAGSVTGLFHSLVWLWCLDYCTGFSCVVIPLGTVVPWLVFVLSISALNQ